MASCRHSTSLDGPRSHCSLLRSIRRLIPVQLLLLDLLAPRDLAKDPSLLPPLDGLLDLKSCLKLAGFLQLFLVGRLSCTVTDRALIVSFANSLTNHLSYLSLPRLSRGARLEYDHLQRTELGRPHHLRNTDK